MSGSVFRIGLALLPLLVGCSRQVSSNKEEALLLSLVPKQAALDHVSTIRGVVAIHFSVDASYPARPFVKSLKGSLTRLGYVEFFPKVLFPYQQLKGWNSTVERFSGSVTGADRYINHHVLWMAWKRADHLRYLCVRLDYVSPLPHMIETTMDRPTTSQLEVMIISEPLWYLKLRAARHDAEWRRLNRIFLRQQAF